MNHTSTLETTSFLALEEAREAVTTLRALKSLLSKQDEETLALLIDKELMRDLEKSVMEAKKERLESIVSILE